MGVSYDFAAVAERRRSEQILGAFLDAVYGPASPANARLIHKDESYAAATKLIARLRAALEAAPIGEAPDFEYELWYRGPRAKALGKEPTDEATD
jgi:hypothetical protein